MSESSQKHKATAPTKLNFALIMCSTSRFTAHKAGSTMKDSSSDLIIETLRKYDKKLVSRVLVADDKEAIREAIRDALKNEDVNAVLIVGGTGIAPKDITIETVSPLLEKTLPGFGELFRSLSYDEIGSPAIMSRAVAGVTEGKAIFCIPGSPNAVKLCLDKLILPETGHIVKHAREDS
ncbi:MogA/MoaB family molybdenum cofactor biosynthesis protein [Candidatus Bathyarchaeota archaeon]|nr:MogA/MoaB family molybdenum cofactor biosynthesis protein [Candidatus Bathyarchaeota archaeon]